MGNVSDTSWRENQNTYFMLNLYFLKFTPFMRCWKNMVQQEGPQMTIYRVFHDLQTLLQEVISYVFLIKKSSHKQVSDSGRLPSYDRLKLRR